MRVHPPDIAARFAPSWHRIDRISLRCGTAAGFGAQYPVGRPGNQAVTLMKHYASRSDLVDRAIGSVGLIMRIWLEYDPVALAVLVFGIAAIEFLAFNI